MKSSSALPIACLALCLVLHSDLAGTLYVALESPSPSPPYNTWATAARSIQEAVDAAEDGDTILVADGVYATGGRIVDGLLSNRVVLDKAILVQSQNGPAVTVIEGTPASGHGDGAVRCAYVGSGATLSGFTLTKGHTRRGPRSPITQVRGGGAFCHPSGVLVNCVVRNNSSFDDGGGVQGGTVYRSLIADNDSDSWVGGPRGDGDGGGANGSTLYNCVLRGNRGRKGGAVDNCIVYHNTAVIGPNYERASIHFSCTTPLPTGGIGNLTEDPKLASRSHLSAESPCIGVGSALFGNGLDVDGQPWEIPPSMWADQFTSGVATGPVTVVIQHEFFRLAVGFAASFRVSIDGNVTASRWSFGDGTVVHNQLEVQHVWNMPGSYPVELRAFNDSFPLGVAATVIVEVLAQPIHYVNHASPNPTAPYTTLQTAAAKIQDAIDASDVAERLILVAAGTYDRGGVVVDGTMTNRIALRNGATVRSLQGAAATIVKGAPAPGAGLGDGAVRCAYLDDYCVLEGFTLTQGHTRSAGHPSREQGGGGAWCKQIAVVSRCIVSDNRAQEDGGGANGGNYFACTFTTNSAKDEGGGVDDAVLSNCMLVGNLTPGWGGAASESILIKCTVVHNTVN